MARYTATADIWRDFERAAAEARQEARPQPITADRADDRLARAQQHPRWAIAVHEAAHAVVFSVCAERTIEEATIEERRYPNGKTYGGSVKPGPVDDPTTRHDHEDIVVNLAGPIAHQRAAPNDIDFVQSGANSDDANVGILLERAGGSLEDLRLHIRTANFVVDRLWPQIEAVAVELIDRTTIGDQEVKRAIARAGLTSAPNAGPGRTSPTSSPSQTRRIDLPLQTRKAPLAASSVDADRRTVTLTFTTGAAVRRRDYEGPFDEVLVVSKDALILDRLNAGAPVLDSHSAYSTTAQIAVVERAWIEGSEGRATVRFPRPGVDQAADRLFGLIEDRIIKNVSVGYRIHRMKVVPGSREAVRQHVAEKWEPFEISFVTVPADIGAQVRSSDKTFACEVITTPSLEATKAQVMMKGRVIQMELDHMEIRLQRLEANSR